jgi:hypothetical protein
MLRIIPLISSLLIRSFLHVRIRIVSIAGLMLLQTVVMAQTWTTQNTSGMNYAWQSLAYGSSKFVSVGRPVPGQPDRVMTSPNGTTWTGVEHNLGPVNFNDIVYANNIFVAVASLNQAGDNGVRVMTSPDGINWTGRSAPNADWQSVTYGNGIFVAVATVVNGGGATKVMTSANGINWTARNPSSTANYWRGVTFGNGMFVAVSASSPTGHPSFMTSLDGINWTGRTPPGNAAAWAVTYGNGLFVSVAESGALMTSPDGMNWTIQYSPAANTWQDVAYGNGRFVAVASSGKGNRAMSSVDGTTWLTENTPVDNDWKGITFSGNIFVAISETGTVNQVMRRSESGGKLPVSIVEFGGEVVNSNVRLKWKTSWEQNSKYYEVERSFDGSVYTKVGTVSAAGNSERLLTYEFLDRNPPEANLYYRLRLTDMNARVSYSNDIRIRTGSLSEVIIGPNPTGGQASMILPPSWTGRYDCMVISMNGIVMYETKGLRAGSHSIDLSTFSPGLYRLMIWDNGECLYQQWIMRR